MRDDETVYRLAQDCFPGLLYRTAQECLAAAHQEQEAQRAWEAARHPGDVQRSLGPLHGAPDDVAVGQVVRWRTVDHLDRLLALCSTVLEGREPEAGASTLTVDEAECGLCVLRRLRTWAGCVDDAAWWCMQTGLSLSSILDALHRRFATH